MLFSAYLSSHCQGINSKKFFHNREVGYSGATRMFPLYFGPTCATKVSIRPQSWLVFRIAGIYGVANVTIVA